MVDKDNFAWNIQLTFNCAFSMSDFESLIRNLGAIHTIYDFGLNGTNGCAEFNGCNFRYYIKDVYGADMPVVLSVLSGYNGVEVRTINTDDWYYEPKCKPLEEDRFIKDVMGEKSCENAWNDWMESSGFNEYVRINYENDD